MQRVVPILLFFLLVFGVGFSLGVQGSPLQAPIALGFGGVAVMPVVLAYLAATRRREATGTNNKDETDEKL